MLCIGGASEAPSLATLLGDIHTSAGRGKDDTMLVRWRIQVPHTCVEGGGDACMAIFGLESR
jgi:hypothetical protein